MNKQNVFNPCLKLCDQYCSSSKFVAGIVSIFRNDLTSIRVFTDYLGVDKKLLLLILAWASRRSDLLHDNYSKVSKAIEVESEDALKTLVDIHSGSSKWITKLKQENKLFTSIDKQITRNLFTLNKYGMKMRGIHNPFDVPVNIAGNLSEIYNKLCSVIGYKEKNNVEEAKNNNNQNKNNKPDENSKDNDQQDIKKHKLFKHLKNFIMAVWGDLNSIEYMEEKLKKKISKNSSEISKIWSAFPNKTNQIIKKSLRNVYYSALSTVLRINKNIDKRIKKKRAFLLEKNIIKNTGRDSQTSFHKLKEDNDDNEERKDNNLSATISDGFDINDFSNEKDFEEVERELGVEERRVAFRIGCTVNITRNKLLLQDYYICNTCTNKNGIDVKMCLPCAEFWHAGHQYDKIKKYSKIVCSWGGHHFKNLDINQEQNPLYRTSYKDKLSKHICSLLKMNSKFIKIKEQMYKEKGLISYKEDLKEQYSDESRSAVPSCKEDEVLV